METAFTSSTLRDAVERYLDAVIEIYTAEEGQPPGCLVFSTAPASSAEPAVQEVLRSTLDELDSALQDQLGREWCEGPKLTLPVRSAALLVAATIHSLAIRARAGDDPEELRQIPLTMLEALFQGDSP
jgi:hypothetical protein